MAEAEVASAVLDSMSMISLILSSEAVLVVLETAVGAEEDRSGALICVPLWILHLKRPSLARRRISQSIRMCLATPVRGPVPKQRKRNDAQFATVQDRYK